MGSLFPAHLCPPLGTTGEAVQGVPTSPERLRGSRTPHSKKGPHAAPSSAAGALGSTESHLGLKSLSQLMEHQRASQLLTVCFLPGTWIN